MIVFFLNGLGMEFAMTLQTIKNVTMIKEIAVIKTPISIFVIHAYAKMEQKDH